MHALLRRTSAAGSSPAFLRWGYFEYNRVVSSSSESNLSERGGHGQGRTISSETKRAYAVQAVRQAILDGLYAPGERLREERLAADLDIRPTPIREALLILEAQGLVKIWPRRGATVVELTRDDIVDIYRIRNVLEPFATRTAMDRLTPYPRSRRPGSGRGRRGFSASRSPRRRRTRRLRSGGEGS